MQVILNFARFSAFWLPVQCGERMGLSITSLLKAVASELVVSSNLPSSSEMTWFQSFSLTEVVELDKKKCFTHSGFVQAKTSNQKEQGY